MKKRMMLVLLLLFKVVFTSVAQEGKCIPVGDPCYPKDQWSSPGCLLRIINCCHQQLSGDFYPLIDAYQNPRLTPQIYTVDEIRMQLAGKKWTDFLHLYADFGDKTQNKDIHFTKSKIGNVRYSVALFRGIVEGNGIFSANAATEFRFYKAYHSDTKKYDIIFEVYGANGLIYLGDVSDAYPLLPLPGCPAKSK